MAGMLFSFIEAAENPPGIQCEGKAGIANLSCRVASNVDIAMRGIVVAGVAEKIVQQDIDQFGAGPDGGR